jgi:hypothetical protein
LQWPRRRYDLCFCRRLGLVWREVLTRLTSSDNVLCIFNMCRPIKPLLDGLCW